MIPPPAEIRRIVYLGTPDVAVPPLRALHAAGFEIPLVISRPDKRRGRGGASSPSPVKAAALDLGLPVTTDVDAALEVDADLGVVVAFGRIIKPHVLAELAMVNIHFSLLPRWRGAAPVERALLAGDEVTGVCLMALAQELDTGDVYRMEELAVRDDHTLETLRDELVEIGTRLLVDGLVDGLGTPSPQTGEASYAAKIDPTELRIDWSRSAADIDRVIRLGNAWTTHDGKRLKIWAARPIGGDGGPGSVDGIVVHTGEGSLALIEVQPEGKPRRRASDWANGVGRGADVVLGS
ncbi:MAG: methionyl-tRNA formyltransferase [Actinomycetota bacterium]